MRKTKAAWILLLLIAFLVLSIVFNVFQWHKASEQKDAFHKVAGLRWYTLTLPSQWGDTAPMVPLWWVYPDGKCVSATNMCWGRNMDKPVEVTVFLWDLDQEHFGYALACDEWGETRGEAKNLLYHNGSFAIGFDDRVIGTHVKSVDFRDVTSGPNRGLRLVVSYNRPMGNGQWK